MISQPNLGSSRVIPRRSRQYLLIPLAVGLCMVALLAWSIWPLLRPARLIEIEQAILVSANNQDVPVTQSSSISEMTKSTRMVQAAGWLEAQPYFVAATALADGVIEDMLILEGDRVEAGQALARMVDDDAKLRLARVKAEHASSLAAFSLAQARLAAAEQNWDEPYELERAVAIARSRVQGLQAELTRLPSLIRTEQALLIKAQEEHRRTESAYQNNATSEIEYIAARENLNAQAARLEATQAQTEILGASLQQAEADLTANLRALDLRIDDRERLETARAQADLAESKVTHQAAVLDEAQLELERMTIRAPISGFVQRRLKAPGDKVLRGMDDPYSAHIVHIYDPSKLQVRVDVPLADASQVYIGQRCEVVVEVLPDRTFEGEVLIVLHEADLQKNTLQIKVRVIDPDPILRPEMLTRVKFIPDQSSPQIQINDRLSVKVPASVLDTSMDTKQVWIVTNRNNGRGVLRPVEVNIESRDNDWVTLNGDIAPGALIALDPESCTQGERVRFVSTPGGAS